jgi:site-specific recombinase XerD
MRHPTPSLLSLTQSFFSDYLQGTRGASPHTVRAYRDGVKLFFLFLAAYRHRNIADLTLDDIQSEAVLAFLNHVESNRGNSAATRNSRLAALHSFVQHLLRQDVTRAGQYGRILAIRPKRTHHRTIPYLEPEEARAVIEAVTSDSPQGRRDRALLLLLYNTGARVSEVLAVRAGHFRLDRMRQVRLIGKGRKERVCPLWPETAAAIRQIIVGKTNDEIIFNNLRGYPLSRDGVAYLLTKYVQKAATTIPELRTRQVTPHGMRHSCAFALLQAGVDVSVIRDYLGHASIETTSRYVTTNLQMKRDVLEAFWKRAHLARRPQRKWRPSPQLLAFLDTL